VNVQNKCKRNSDENINIDSKIQTNPAESVGGGLRGITGTRWKKSEYQCDFFRFPTSCDLRTYKAIYYKTT
jgi:hypothetical protein